MPKLFESIFAYLEFTKCDKIEIEHIVVLFELDKRPEKRNDASKVVCSSRDFQDFIIETLDTETISHSRDFWIFFVQCFYEIQYFLFRIRVKLDSQFSEIL